MAQKAYFILGSQRSGTTLLCDLLAQTGLAGAPAEHFYHGENDEFSYKQFPVHDYPAYIRQVVADSQTDNGVYGAQLMAGVAGGWDGPMQRLRQSPHYAQMPLPAILDEFFPDLQYIYLTRRNKIAQAVSWWKMAQGAPGHRTTDTPETELELAYNFNAIDHLIDEAMMEEAAHQAFLDAVGAVPYTIVYEDYIQDMAGTIRGILDFLQITGDYVDPTPRFIRTANAQSEAWMQRYREEKQAKWQNVRW